MNSLVRYFDSRWRKGGEETASRLPLVRGLLEVRVLVDDGNVSNRGSARLPALGRRDRRGGFGEKLRPGEGDHDGACRGGEQDGEDAYGHHSLGVVHLQRVVGVDLVEGCGREGGLDGSLGHPGKGDEYFLLEVQVGAYADQDGGHHADHYAGEKAAHAQVHRLPLQFVDLDLGARHAEQDRLEYHPEDLERCRHWILETMETMLLLNFQCRFFATRSLKSIFCACESVRRKRGSEEKPLSFQRLDLIWIISGYEGIFENSRSPGVVRSTILPLPFVSKQMQRTARQGLILLCDTIAT